MEEHLCKSTLKQDGMSKSSTTIIAPRRIEVTSDKNSLSHAASLLWLFQSPSDLVPVSIRLLFWLISSKCLHCRGKLVYIDSEHGYDNRCTPECRYGCQAFNVRAPCTVCLALAYRPYSVTSVVISAVTQQSQKSCTCWLVALR